MGVVERREVTARGKVCCVVKAPWRWLSGKNRAEARRPGAWAAWVRTEKGEGQALSVRTCVGERDRQWSAAARL